MFEQAWNQIQKKEGIVSIFLQILNEICFVYAI